MTATAVRTARKQRQKPARSIAWVSAPLTANHPFGAVRITNGKASYYYVRELPADEGRGFEVEKLDLTKPAEDRDRYHVFFSHNGQDHSCDCLGFTHHGHCKHSDGLRALVLTR